MKKNITKEMIIELVTGAVRDKKVVSDLTVREIAKIVGCSHPNIYNHFSGIEEIMWEVLGNVFRKMRIESMKAEIEEIKDIDSEKKLKKYIKSWVNFYMENPGWYRILWYCEFKGEMPQHIRVIAENAGQNLASFLTSCFPEIDSAQKAKCISEMLIAYIHGEVSIVMARRDIVFKSEDLAEKIFKNSLKIVKCFNNQ